MSHADPARKELSVLIGAGRHIRLSAPADQDRLLDAIDALKFREDERMPYWAELWPAGTELARWLGGPGAAAVAGEDVLELGSGLGLCGIAAALAGAREVTFSDYFPESLAFSAENARRNGVGGFATLLLDWRRPPEAMRWSTIIGADLLYELRNTDALLGALRALLAPGGTAWIADPDRLAAERFPARAQELGFALARTSLAPRVTLYRLR